MAAHRPKSMQSDSFKDLTSLMKAKKPYAPITQPDPSPQLSFATNDMQFASPTTTTRKMLSPLATPFKPPETVAEYLRKQDLVSTTESPRPVWEHGKLDHHHLDLIQKRFDQARIDDEIHNQTYPQAQSFSYKKSTLIPDLIDAWNPPSPIGITQPTISVNQTTQKPVVRLTKPEWDSLCTDLRRLTGQKQSLESKLGGLQRDNKSLRSDEHEIGAQIGKLHYQNEIDKDQQASMVRSLSQREIEIKNLQLHIDELTKKLSEADYELQRSRNATKRVEEKLKRLALERDTAMIAQANTGAYAAYTQNLASSLTLKEQIITDLRQKHLKEQMKVSDLEEEVEMLKRIGSQENTEDVNEELREKTIQCDYLQSQLKVTEQQLQDSQERVARFGNDAESLRGAAHLVAPNPKGKLPKNVIACSECYATNLPCDNNVRCRNCIERNEKCTRWRCSLKHRLGDCTLLPCKFPHDSQGWLILHEARPQW